MVKTIFFEGRVFQVVEENETLRFTTLKGECADLYEFLLCLMHAGIMQKVLLYDYNRKNPAVIDVHRGMSGCVDYKIRWQTDKGFIHQRKIFHVSMYNKVNEDVEIWEGDLQKLLFEVDDFYDKLPHISDYYFLRNPEDKGWRVIEEKEVNGNRMPEPKFEVPCRNWLNYWAHDGGDSNEQYADPKYRVAAAIYDLIEGSKGYKKFFGEYEEPEEA